MKQSELEFINNLRQSSPYVAQHRGKTLVIYVPGELISKPDALLEFARDIILLKSLSIKVVLTLGATQQIDAAFNEAQLPWETHHNQRITTKAHLVPFQKTIGWVRAQLEAAFSQASAEHQTPNALVSGNWVIAKPKGVIEGIDFQHTGALRKINHQAIESTLNTQQIALITPLTYSLTGEVFNLNTLELAFALSQQLKADKLMIYLPQQQLNGLPKAFSLNEIAQHQDQIPARLVSKLQKYGKGIQRIHLMDQAQPGAILLELFSRDGLGCLIFTDRYHQIRPATHDDVAGILMLISPLEAEGILVKRPRETLEREIPNFTLIEIDQTIVGCAALYPLDATTAELACLAINPLYQGKNLGQELLQTIELKAKQQGFSQLCLLTTHTEHWFIEQGFANAPLSSLPPDRQVCYNYQRQSKVLIKPI